MRSMDMKSKSLLKFFTLLFFFSTLTVFVLFQSGFIKSEKRLVAHDEFFRYPEGKKQLGLSTFQQLKLRGAFDPENFSGSAIHYTTYDEVHLSSSKSIIIRWDDPVGSGRTNNSYLKSLLKTQFERKKEKP